MVFKCSTPATGTRDKPRLQDVGHTKGKPMMLKKRHGCGTTTTVTDVSHGYLMMAMVTRRLLRISATGPCRILTCSYIWPPFNWRPSCTSLTLGRRAWIKLAKGLLSHPTQVSFNVKSRIYLCVLLCITYVFFLKFSLTIWITLAAVSRITIDFRLVIGSVTSLWPGLSVGRSFCRLVGWWIGRSVGKLLFHGPIVTPFFYSGTCVCADKVFHLLWRDPHQEDCRQIFNHPLR